VAHDVRVRFEATRALDAIERRLATDPVRTSGVVDVAEAVRLADLDGGRPVSLLRLGLLVDGLARLLGDAAAALYPVAERGLLSDTELTSNERMVLRRWSDDGLVEILPAGTPVLARAGEIGALTGQPVLTRAPFNGYALRPAADSGGAMLVPVGPGPVISALAQGEGAPPPSRSPGISNGPHPALTRMWRCPVPDCPSFGRPGAGQPPPRLAPGGAPVCPRHGERLFDAGPRPPVAVLVVRVDGLVRKRFAVVAGAPAVVVGRAPEDRGGVELAPYLDDRAGARISRRHVALDLRPDGLYATDMSTNGTHVVVPGGARRLTQGQPYRLGDQEILELVEGVQVARAGAVAPVNAAPRSIMAEAPTVAIRMPRER
jgi:hypothetical protein